MSVISVTNIGSNSGVAISSLAVTVPAGGVPAGSQIIVCISDNANTGAAGSIVDTAGNTYLVVATATANNGSQPNGLGVIIRARTGLALSPGNTITYTLGTGGTAAAMSAFYATGLLNAAVNVTNTNFGSSTTPSVTSTTPSNPGELFVGMVSGQTLISSFTQDSTNAAWASPPGQISLAAPPLGGGNVINPTKTSLTYTPTFGTSDNWAALIVGMPPDPAFFQWFNWLAEPVRRLQESGAYLRFKSAFQPGPETVTEDRWHQPWSEPIRKASIAALAASGLAFVPLVSSETVTQDKWYRPWSEPVVSRQALGAYQQQFSAFVKAAPFAERVTEDRWHQPWSEPVRQKPGLLAGAQQTLAHYPLPIVAAATTSEDRWHQLWLDPVRAKPTIAFQPFDACFPAGAETVTEDRWHQPWSEPVRKPGLLAGAQQTLAWSAFTPATAVTPPFWYQPWSEPVRKPGLLAGAQQVLAWRATAVTPPFWYQPWSEPSVKARAVPFYESSAFTAFISTSTSVLSVDCQWVSPRFDQTVQYQTTTNPVSTATAPVVPAFWHQPWSEPVRQKQGLLAGAQQAFAYYPLPIVAAATSEDRWHQLWPDPVRAKPTIAFQPFDAFFQAGPETVTEDRWHQPWSEPVRKPGLLAGAQQALAWSAFTPATTVAPPFWYQSWSEPVRQKPGFLAGAQQTLAWSAFTPATAVTPPFWYQPWSEPVRQKPGLLAAAQQTLAWNAFTPATTPPPVLLCDCQWVSPRFDQTVQYQTTVNPIFTAAAPVVPAFWYQPWSEPVRQKPGLLAGAQQTLAWGTFTPAAVIAPAFWYQPWSEPSVKAKSSVPFYEFRAFTALTPPPVLLFDCQWVSPSFNQQIQYQTTTNPVSTASGQIVTADKWYKAWVDPVRLKSPIASLPFTIFFQAGPETVTEDRWHQPWSEPVRQKLGLWAGAQQVLAWGAFTPVSGIVPAFLSQPWSEPARFKVLPTALQPFFTTTAFTPPPVVVPAFWYQPWSEPVRQKLGLWAGAQQTVAWNTLTPPPVIVPTMTYPALAEPVRVKLGLTTNLQQWLAHSPRVLLPTITGTLVATEMGDSALFGGITFVPPASAQIGLTELGLLSTSSGLIEGPRQYAIVSIVVI